MSSASHVQRGGLSNLPFILDVVSCLQDNKTEEEIDLNSLLTKHDIHLNNQDSDGNTALHVALYSPSLVNDLKADKNIRTQLVRILLNAGIDVNICNDHYKKALHFAVSKSYKDIVPLLLSKNAEVNCLDDKKKTTFHYAVENNEISILQDLIFAGANLAIKFPNDLTCLEVAINKKHKDIILLLKHTHNADAIIRGETKPYPEIYTLQPFVDRRRDGLKKANTIAAMKGEWLVHPSVEADCMRLEEHFGLNVVYVRELYKLAQTYCQKVTFKELSVYTKEFLLLDGVRNLGRLRGVSDAGKKTSVIRASGENAKDRCMPDGPMEIISSFFKSENPSPFDTEILGQVDALLERFLSAGKVIMIIPSAENAAILPDAGAGGANAADLTTGAASGAGGAGAGAVTRRNQYGGRAVDNGSKQTLRRSDAVMPKPTENNGLRRSHAVGPHNHPSSGETRRDPLAYRIGR